MNTQPNIAGRSFRFCTGRGQMLTDRIAAIEALATERLRAGISYESVRTGALALLQVALSGITGKLIEPTMDSAQIPACPPPSEPPRYAAPGG